MIEATGFWLVLGRMAVDGGPGAAAIVGPVVVHPPGMSEFGSRNCSIVVDSGEPLVWIPRPSHGDGGGVVVVDDPGVDTNVSVEGGEGVFDGSARDSVVQLVSPTASIMARLLPISHCRILRQYRAGHGDSMVGPAVSAVVRSPKLRPSPIAGTMAQAPQERTGR